MAVAPQEAADVQWHKPQMVLTHGSDNLRAWRQQEEPALTFALWEETPPGLRWSLSADALQHIRATAPDAERRAWAQEQLDKQGSGPKFDWRTLGRRARRPAQQHGPARRQTWSSASASSSWQDPGAQWWTWENMTWANRGGW